MAYTTDQINSALSATLASNPNVSYQDLLSAAQQYGVGREDLNLGLKAIGAPAYLSQYDQYAGPSFDNVKWDPTYDPKNPASGSYSTNGLIGLNSGTAPLPNPTTSTGSSVSPGGRSSSGMKALQLGNPFAYDQKNPYLSQMANTITRQVNDNLTRNVMPQIASGAQMTGGFGGSRQGVVEANALRDANQGLSNSLTGMYYGDYNNTMNRQLQKYGMDQNYNLGIGSLDLGYQNSNNNYALGMGQLQLGHRNTDLNQMQLGANLFQQGNQGYLNQGQGIYNLGLTGQQAPWQAVDNFNNASKPYTGFGSTTQNTNGSAGAGFLGGAIGAGQMYNLWNQPQKTA